MNKKLEEPYARWHRRRSPPARWPADCWSRAQPTPNGSPPSQSRSSFPGRPAAPPTRSRAWRPPRWKRDWAEKIVVVNQPGGAGSIGTKAVMDAPRDGYTWTAGAAKQLGTYPLLGMINSKVDDFHLFLAVTNVSDRQREPFVVLQDVPATAGSDEGEAGIGFDSRQQLLGALRHGGDQAGNRRQVSPRHL